MRSPSIKTTDSALTGTNLRLILRNMDITDVIVAGIFTDQCVSSTVRSLADESFGVVVVEDCCAAATMELHEAELQIINMIYCHVASRAEAEGFIQGPAVMASLYARDAAALSSMSHLRFFPQAVTGGQGCWLDPMMAAICWISLARGVRPVSAMRTQRSARR